jgi:hypothetical protein
MKKIFLLLAIAFFTLPTFAQRARTLLKIRDMEGRNITAEINGRRYDRVAQVLTIKDFPPGRHSIRIYVVSNRNNGRDVARLIYAGRIKTNPGKIYYITVDDYEKLDIIEDCCLGDSGPWTENDGWYRARRNDQQDWERDLQMNPQRDDYYYKKKDRNSQFKKSPEDDWSHFSNAMSTAQHNSLLKQLKDASFESNRLDITKQAIDDNHLTCAQLVSIMNEMSFESSKLQMAKYAYKKLVDPQNTFTINEGFGFSSSKDEFREFVQSNR